MLFSKSLPTAKEPCRSRSSPRIDQHAGQNSKASPSPSGSYGIRSHPHDSQTAPLAREIRHASTRPA